MNSNYNTLDGKITTQGSLISQNAASILLKVEKNGVIGSINLSSEVAKIAVTKFIIEGLVTANSYFKILLDGSMEAVNGKFSGSININNLFTVNNTGYLTSTSGNIGGWDISSGGLTSYNTSTSINLYNGGNHAMQLSYNGLHLYNHYSGNNEYLGGEVAAYNSTNGTNGIILAQASTAEYLSIGYADASTPYSGMPIYMDMIYTRNGYLDYQQGFHFFKPVYLESTNLVVEGDVNCYTVNGYTPITNNNFASTFFNIKNNYTYPPSSHPWTHSTLDISVDLTPDGNINFPGTENASSVNWVQTNYTTQSAFNALVSRVSALESA